MTDRADNFIRSLGVEAYRVGGSVRDEIIGRRPKDADYMVRGVPMDELGAFLRDLSYSLSVTPIRDRRSQQIGWRVFGMRGLGLIEITLPRRESNAGEGRAQTIVVDPNLSLEEDAQRRDFTFNALYKGVFDGFSSLVAGPNGQIYENIVDPLGGLEDLQRKTVRITHPDSFRDDPLRTLRALRFVSTLGYDLAESTLGSMWEHADAVTGLSEAGYASGTVLDEFSKMLMGQAPGKALRIARDTGVLGTLFPALRPMMFHDAGSRWHDLTTDEHTFKALETAAHVGAPLRVRWALLFHDSGKPEVEWVGKDGRKHYYAKDGTEDHEVASERIWRAAAEWMNAPRELRDDASRLILNHMVPLDGRMKASKVRRMRTKFGDEMLHDLFLHRACDVSGKLKGVKSALDRIKAMEDARQAAQDAEVPAFVKDLKVSGKDAQALGLSGKEIGEALRRVLREVASEPTPTTLSREWQMRRLEQSR